MKKLYIITIGLLLAGCASHQDEPEVQQQWKPLAAPKAGAEFHDRIASRLPVSVSVSLSKLDEYARNPEAVVAQWKAMGVREVFFQVTSTDFLGKWNDGGKTIRKLLSLLRAKGMTGGFWIKEIDWRCPEPGILSGRIPRRSGVEKRIIDDWRSSINAQRERKEEGILPDRVVLEIGCRNYVRHSRRTPEKTLYTWSESGYGKKGENSLLFEDSVRANQELGEVFQTPVILALDSEYLAAGRQGKLSGADVNALLTHFDQLIVIGSAARPGSNAQQVLPFLTDVRVSAGIRPAAHASLLQDGLRRRSWKDFIASMEFLLKKWSASRCRSVVIADFDRLDPLMECAENEAGK